MHPLHVVLAEHVNYEPDLCLISKERLHILQSPRVVGPPDLIIEVLSPSNIQHDTVTKFRHYQQYGVREYWIVDPEAERLEVWFLEGPEYKSLGNFSRGDYVTTRVLEGLKLDPAQVF